jgi:hypothetical protein
VLPLRGAVPILGIGTGESHSFLRQRASPLWAETASAGSVAQPSPAAR